MQSRNLPRAERRAQLAALKLKPGQKTPRPAPKVVDISEAQLRRLTASVLDELKLPGAIPSNIILAALKAARAL